MSDARLAIEERLPGLLKKHHLGAGKAVTGRALLTELRAEGMNLPKTAARRLQEAVHQLRLRGVPIGSTSHDRKPGYFWLATDAERSAFCSEMRRRIGAIARVMRSQGPKKHRPEQFNLFAPRPT